MLWIIYSENFVFQLHVPFHLYLEETLLDFPDIVMILTVHWIVPSPLDAALVTFWLDMEYFNVLDMESGITLLQHVKVKKKIKKGYHVLQIFLKKSKFILFVI